MLQIHIPKQEHLWDEVRECFIDVEECDLMLEHSLLSISKWEGIYHKPFIGRDQKSFEQVLTYIKCMTINKNVPDDVFLCIPQTEMTRIQEYIDDDHTATFFRDPNGKKTGASPKKEIITSEVIYYYMISLNIPVEFEKWHLGRLMTLIKVCNEKNREAEQAAKRKGKRGKSNLTTREQHDLAARYHDLNEARKKQLGTRG